MNQKIIDFINEQECVYVVETEDMVLDSIDPNLGYEVLGISKKGIIFEWMDTYGIEKWSDIENYSLVSIVDCYSSERGGDDRRNITYVFDCKTLESTKINLVIY